MRQRMGAHLTILITSDIHLSDRPRDAYRFGLFRWLRKQQEKYKVEALFCLGDLTDSKDRHSAKLVNALVDGLKCLRGPIYILKGNHDYVDPDNPFFRFLNELDGVTFITHTMGVSDIHCIPHQPDQAALDTAFLSAPEGGLVFCHQTFTGAISETGRALTGLSLPPNKAMGVYSGDIHVPHVVNTPNGNVTYIGAPYHIHFGDEYTPRVLLLNTDLKATDLHYPSPQKVSKTIRHPSELDTLTAGTQVKLTVELTRAELVEWANLKKQVLDYCKSRQLEVYGIELKAPAPPQRRGLKAIKGKTDEGYFSAFCNAENLDKYRREMGLKLIGGAT